MSLTLGTVQREKGEGRREKGEGRREKTPFVFCYAKATSPNSYALGAGLQK